MSQVPPEAQLTPPPPATPPQEPQVPQTPQLLPGTGVASELGLGQSPTPQSPIPAPDQWENEPPLQTTGPKPTYQYTFSVGGATHTIEAEHAPTREDIDNLADQMGWRNPKQYSVDLGDGVRRTIEADKPPTQADYEALAKSLGIKPKSVTLDQKLDPLGAFPPIFSPQTVDQQEIGQGTQADAAYKKYQEAITPTDQGGRGLDPNHAALAYRLHMSSITQDGAALPEYRFQSGDPYANVPKANTPSAYQPLRSASIIQPDWDKYKESPTGLIPPNPYQVALAQPSNPEYGHDTKAMIALQHPNAKAPASVFPKSYNVPDTAQMLESSIWSAFGQIGGGDPAQMQEASIRKALGQSSGVLPDELYGGSDPDGQPAEEKRLAPKIGSVTENIAKGVLPLVDPLRLLEFAGNIMADPIATAKSLPIPLLRMAMMSTVTKNVGSFSKQGLPIINQEFDPAAYAQNIPGALMTAFMVRGALHGGVTLADRGINFAVENRLQTDGFHPEVARAATVLANALQDYGLQVRAHQEAQAVTPPANMVDGTAHDGAPGLSRTPPEIDPKSIISPNQPPGFLQKQANIIRDAMEKFSIGNRLDIARKVASTLAGKAAEETAPPTESGSPPTGEPQATGVKSPTPPAEPATAQPGPQTQPTAQAGPTVEPVQSDVSGPKFVPVTVVDSAPVAQFQTPEEAIAAHDGGHIPIGSIVSVGGKYFRAVNPVAQPQEAPQQPTVQPPQATAPAAPQEPAAPATPAVPVEPPKPEPINHDQASDAISMAFRRYELAKLQDSTTENDARMSLLTLEKKYRLTAIDPRTLSEHFSPELPVDIQSHTGPTGTTAQWDKVLSPVIIDAANNIVRRGVVTTKGSLSNRPELQGISIGPTRARHPAGSEWFHLENMVVPLDSLMASHHEENFTPTPEYPPEIQPRGRNHEQLVAQVRQNAAHLNEGEQLTADYLKTDEGAPIVSSDGTVEAGNGRAMSMKLARNQNNPRWQAYEKHVLSMAPEAAGMKDPVLVRVRRTPLTSEQRADFVDKANGRGTAATTAVEDAVKTAGILNADTIRNLVPVGKSLRDTILSPQNSVAVSKFLQSIPPNERVAIGSDTGAIAQAMESAILARVLGRHNAPVLDSIISEGEVGARIVSGLKLSAINLLKALNATETGEVSPLLNFQSILGKALERCVEYANAPNKAVNFDQAPMTGLDEAADYGYQMFRRLVKAKSAAQVSEIFNDLADAITGATAPGFDFGDEIQVFERIEQVFDSMFSKEVKAAGEEVGLSPIETQAVAEYLTTPDNGQGGMFDEQPESESNGGDQPQAAEGAGNGNSPEAQGAGSDANSEPVPQGAAEGQGSPASSGNEPESGTGSEGLPASSAGGDAVDAGSEGGQPAKPDEAAASRGGPERDSIIPETPSPVEDPQIPGDAKVLAYMAQIMSSIANGNPGMMTTAGISVEDLKANLIARGDAFPDPPGGNVYRVANWNVTFGKHMVTWEMAPLVVPPADYFGSDDDFEAMLDEAEGKTAPAKPTTYQEWQDLADRIESEILANHPEPKPAFADPAEWTQKTNRWISKDPNNPLFNAWAEAMNGRDSVGAAEDEAKIKTVDISPRTLNGPVPQDVIDSTLRYVNNRVNSDRAMGHPQWQPRDLFDSIISQFTAAGFREGWLDKNISDTYEDIVKYDPNGKPMVDQVVSLMKDMGIEYAPPMNVLESKSEQPSIEATKKPRQPRRTPEQKRADEIAAYNERLLGPQRVGGVYRSSYNGKNYEILAIHKDGSGRVVNIQARTIGDTRVRNHLASWDPRDKVISQPRDTEPVDAANSPSTKNVDEAPESAPQNTPKPTSKPKIHTGIEGADEGFNALADIFGIKPPKSDDQVKESSPSYSQSPKPDRSESLAEMPDPDIYEKVLPIFTDTLKKYIADGKTAQDFIKDVYSNLGGTISPRPYLKQFRADLSSGKVDLNAPSSNPNLERPGVGPATSKQDMGSDHENGSGPDDGSAGQDQQADGEGGLFGASDIFLPASVPAAGGEPGDLFVRPGDPQPQYEGDSSGSGQREGGGGISHPRDDVEPDRAGPTESPTGSLFDEPGSVNTPAPFDGTIIHGDIDNIRASLPELLPGQQEDVKFAEDRHALPDGYGVLFTNGTGTGKTFTGMGIIKRAFMSGKQNILVLAPSDQIIKAWIETGEKMGIPLKALANTRDNGRRGPVITTYANFYQNDTLAHRDWDLVVPDEAHKLSQNAEGEATSALDMLRAITLHPKGVYRRTEALYPEIFEQLRSLKDQLHATIKQGLNAEPIRQKMDVLAQKARERTEEVRDDVLSRQGDQRTRVAFLSATPWAYVKSVDYAEGYLFDYGADPRSDGYNTPNAQNNFMITHFGYRMRYNKLTQPDASVDTGLMERNFNSTLKQKKVLSARTLDVPHDYDRLFELTPSAIGTRIDEAMKWLHDTEGAHELAREIESAFSYYKRKYLLEAIKSAESLDYIQKHMDMGRKIVVFHDLNKPNEGINPFILPFKDHDPTYRLFKAHFPDLFDYPFDEIPGPIEQLKAHFPQMLQFDGTVPKKERRLNVARFNSDDPRHNLIVLQADAGKEGISLHDTTGKFPRVLINLGMPTAPTTALQIEGRIFRIGQMSNAMIRYFNTGTNWERYAFAGTIARRASTAENLALGEGARALKDSFIDGFNSSAKYGVGFDGEGTGGKEEDSSINSVISDWQRAIAQYMGKLKKNSKTKAREGVDWFATPEPIGLKMTHWALQGGTRIGESMLEPSAGDGAIARQFPDAVDRTAVEPSYELASRLATVFDGRIVQSIFENYHISNKHTVVVMNPPFGHGGSYAIAHIEKAYGHLRSTGRIVALIPEGPRADANFENFLYGVDAKGKPLRPDLYLTADIKLPSVTFDRAGTKVMTRIVVLDKTPTPPDSPGAYRDLTHCETMQDLFDKLEHMDVPDRPKPTRTENSDVEGELGSAPVTKDKAFAVDPKDVPYLSKAELEAVAQHLVDAGYIGATQWFTAKNQGMTSSDIAVQKGLRAQQSGEAPEFPPTSSHYPTMPSSSNTYEVFHQKNSRTGEDMYMAKSKNRMIREEFDRVLGIAKTFGGSYNKFESNTVRKGFRFPDAESRDAFLKKIGGNSTDQVNEVGADYLPESSASTAERAGSDIESKPDWHSNPNMKEDARLAKRAGLPRVNVTMTPVNGETLAQAWERSKKNGQAVMEGRAVDAREDATEQPPRSRSLPSALDAMPPLAPDHFPTFEQRQDRMARGFDPWFGKFPYTVGDEEIPEPWLTGNSIIPKAEPLAISNALEHSGLDSVDQFHAKEWLAENGISNPQLIDEAISKFRQDDGAMPLEEIAKEQRRLDAAQNPYVREELATYGQADNSDNNWLPSGIVELNAGITLKDVAKAYTAIVKTNNAGALEHVSLGTDLRNLVVQNLSGLSQIAPDIVTKAARTSASRAEATNVSTRAMAEIGKVTGDTQYPKVFRSMMVVNRLIGTATRNMQIATDVSEMDIDDFLENFWPRYGTIAEAIGCDREMRLSMTMGEPEAARDIFVDAMTRAAAIAAKNITDVMSYKEFYDEASTDKFKAALNAWKTMAEPSIARSHASNEGIFSTALGPLDTYYPLIPVDENGLPMKGKRSFLGVELQKPGNLHNAFATGTNPHGYDTGMGSLVQSLYRSIRVNNKADLISEMDSISVPVTQAIRDAAYPTIRINGVDYAGQIAKIKPDRYVGGKLIPGQERLYPAFALKELRATLGKDSELGVPTARRSALDEEEIRKEMDRQGFPFSQLNALSVAGVYDAYYHAKNGIAALVSGTPFLAGSRDVFDKDGGRITPADWDKQAATRYMQRVMGTAPILKRIYAMYKVLYDMPVHQFTSTEEGKVLVDELIRIGAMPNRYGSETFSKNYAEASGAERHTVKIAGKEFQNPIKMGATIYGPHGLDANVRALLLKSLYAAYPSAKFTDAEKRDFVNQMGVYNRSLEPTLVTMAKQSHLGIFATAGTTKLGVQYRAATGQPMQPESASRAERVRNRLLQVITAGIVGYLATWAIANRMLDKDGKWPWESKVPLGKVPVPASIRESDLGQMLFGKGTDRKFFDLKYGFQSVTGGLSQLGAKAAYTTAVQHSGSKNETMDAMLKDIFNHHMHPFISSPYVQGAAVALTGQQPQISSLRDPITGESQLKGYQVSPPRGTPLAQYYENVKQGSMRTNAALGNIAEQLGFLSKPYWQGNEPKHTPAEAIMKGMLGLFFDDALAADHDNPNTDARLQQEEKAIQTQAERQAQFDKTGEKPQTGRTSSGTHIPKGF